MQETQETQVRSLGREDPLESPTDRGAWWARVHRVVKSQTRLTNLAHTVQS